MNRVGAEVCAGCGHRFAGPNSGGSNPRSEPILWMTPEPDELRLPLDHSEYKPRTTVLGCFLGMLGVLVTIALSLIAFVVAFFVTCAAVPGSGDALIWALLAGVVAAVAVVALSVWIVSLIRKGRNR